MQPLALNKAFTPMDPGPAVVMTTRDDAKGNIMGRSCRASLDSGVPCQAEVQRHRRAAGIALLRQADHASTQSSLAAMRQRGSLTDLHPNQPACSKSGAVHVEANDKAYTSEHRPAGEL